MNNILEKLTILSDFVAKSTTKPDLVEGNYLVFSSDNPSVEDILNKSTLDFDSYNQNEYTINLDSIPNNIGIFLDEEDLRQRAEKIINSKEFLPSKNIAILNYNKNLFFYDFNKRTTYINNRESENFFIENLCSYLKLISKINSGDFLDYFDSLDSEGGIYTSTKGILKLDIPHYPIIIDDSKSIKKDVEKILAKLDDDRFKLHFKNQLFELKKEDNQTKVSSIIFHLNSLYQQADNNYQLELKNFSFDKLKSDLQKEKEKYFTSLREILNKLQAQIVGVPVSIGASVFASYKIDNNYISAIILIAFLVYVSFAIYFQLVYRKDVKEIEKDFNKDFNKISEKSGLSKTDIDDEKGKIDRKIKDINRTIWIFIVAIIVLASLFTIFIFGQVFYPKAKDNSKSINLKGEQIVINSSYIDSLKNVIHTLEYENKKRIPK